MTQKQPERKIKTKDSIIILISIIGILACIAVLFPQVRRMIMDFAEQIVNKEASTYDSWLKVLVSFAMGGICFILFIDYCTLTNSGKALVRKVTQDIKDCLSEIDYRSFIKPVLLLSGIYLLGMLTIIRANFLYLDDMGWAASGHREWFNWSRYMIIFLSYFIQPEIRMTDISPIPQLLAALSLSISSVLLIYIIGNKKITVLRLIASIPLGLSPFFLEFLSYKFIAVYGVLSILLCIVPFLFITRRKAFIFCSIISLLIMCMIYQASAGIYLLIVTILCFQDWNSRKKTNKEILSFIGSALFSFCLALLIFKLFLMKSADYYASSAMHPLSQTISGVLNNIKEYSVIVNHDLGLIWKTCILIVLVLFIIKSISQSEQKKLISFFISVLVIGLLFILSYGIYLLLEIPLYAPRALVGFGVFLAIMCIYIVSDYKKIAAIVVIALSWCLFVFAFSCGNALADQARYSEFRIGLLLRDLSHLYPDADNEDLKIQLKNSIDFTPSIKNISKQNPVIEKLVPKRFGVDSVWDMFYYLEYFNFVHFRITNLTFVTSIDFDTLNLPVVHDSYYHTIKSDGNRILVVLKH